MIERHITFDVHPDRTTEFETFFEERYRPAMAGSPGFVRVELLREADASDRYQMTIRFQDADAAAGWRTSAVHTELAPELAALFSTNEIQAYDVVA